MDPQHVLRATQPTPDLEDRHLSVETDEEDQKAHFAISAGSKALEKAREVHVLLVS